MAISAALEAHSEHPLAKSFMPYRDFSIKTTDSKVINGCGVQAILIGENNHRSSIKIGKPSWLLEADLLEQYKNFQCVLLLNEQLIAAFLLTDIMRDDAMLVIDYLTKNNIHTVMLSGDNQLGCNNIASKLFSIFFCKFHHAEKLKPR